MGGHWGQRGLGGHWGHTNLNLGLMTQPQINYRLLTDKYCVTLVTKFLR
ncbi:MAG: hypothetical protein LBB88_05180 [Planctomycetaceae bacterium]|nr:hypothetical protein [Planctomycetaceae bacterium]